MENQRIRKAQKFLKSAKVLLEHDDPDSCISRCYYALFHASVALLEKFGIKQKKWEHRFVLAEFNKELIHRRKTFSPEVNRTIREVFEQRRESDYNEDEKSFKKAKRALDKTERIFNSILKELENEKP